MRTRLVELDDAAALMNIYNPEVLEMSISFDLVPRDLDEQERWIRAHQATYPCLVAVEDTGDRGDVGARGERILGFALVAAFRSRPAYATTVENSVYVHRQARGCGVGEVLLRELMMTAQQSGFHSLIARIVAGNEGSIRLHEKCGYTLVGTEIEVGRKHGRWLDVVEYQYVVPNQRA